MTHLVIERIFLKSVVAFWIHPLHIRLHHGNGLHNQTHTEVIGIIIEKCNQPSKNEINHHDLMLQSQMLNRIKKELVEFFLTPVWHVRLEHEIIVDPTHLSWRAWSIFYFPLERLGGSTMLPCSKVILECRRPMR